MTFSFPQSAHDFVVLLVPTLTMLLAFAFLIVPGRVLRFMGLEAVPGRPSAIGEGRSIFAGAMLAVGLACLLLQEPLALQPGLNLLLAVGWSIAAFGRVLQMVLDGGLKRKRIQTRFIIALGLAILAWSVTDVPYLACLDFSVANCTTPISARAWFLFAVAALTFAIGIIALFMPLLALKLMRLRVRSSVPFARGEVRGTLAGFYLAIGGIYLLMPFPADFVALVMGAAWFFIGVGRLAAVIFNRGNAEFNLILAIVTGGIGALVIAIVLRMV